MEDMGLYVGNTYHGLERKRQYRKYFLKGLLNPSSVKCPIRNLSFLCNKQETIGVYFKESLNHSGRRSILCFLANFAIMGIVIGAKGITAIRPRLNSLSISLS